VVVKVVWPDEDLDPDDVAGILFFYKTKIFFQNSYIYILSSFNWEMKSDISYDLARSWILMTW